MTPDNPAHDAEQTKDVDEFTKAAIVYVQLSNDVISDLVRSVMKDVQVEAVREAVVALGEVDYLSPSC